MPEQERHCRTLVAASALVPAAALGSLVGRPRAQLPQLLCPERECRGGLLAPESLKVPCETRVYQSLCAEVVPWALWYSSPGRAYRSFALFEVLEFAP